MSNEKIIHEPEEFIAEESHFVTPPDQGISEQLSGVPQERTFSREEKSEIFRIAIEDGISAALQMIADRFENSPDEKNRLAFHNIVHTKDVIRRFDAVIDAIKQSDPSLYDKRTHDIGRLAAAHHDTVQNWEPVATANQAPNGEIFIKIIRKRFAGANEKASTDGALAIIDKINEEAGSEIFTEQDRAIIGGGHEATVPGFNPEKGTVIQPNLNEQSSFITRAIALADLGTAGMDGPERFLPEGDALFREENLDIEEAVKHPETISPQQKEFFRERMLGWSAFQEKFAAGRSTLLEEELRPLPEASRSAVEKLFDKFDESIRAAHAQAEHRKTLTFEELATAMGYTFGHPERVAQVY